MSLTIAMSVDRTELSLSALNINDLTNYRPFAAGPGRLSRNRLTVGSPDVHGELNVSSPFAEAERIVKIRAHSATIAGLWTNLATLRAAFSQESFSIAGTIDGSAFSWVDCSPADIEYGDGGTWQKYHLMSKYQEVTFIIPSSPIPGSGPF